MFWPFQGSKPQPKAHGRRTQREVLIFRDLEIDVHRRAYKRTIGLTLQVSGRIRVSAPLSTPQSRIEQFLFANQEWINEHLRRYELVRAAHPPKRFIESEAFPLLGDELRLRYEPSDRARVSLKKHDSELIAGIPRPHWDQFDPHIPHPELARIFAEFYALTGKSVLTERVEHYSACMGLRPSSLRFRSQKTRWGSCSSRGRISLNWRLVIAPLKVVDYVVVHELAHLKHYNHSSDFWALVATQFPEHGRLREWLRAHQYDGDFLAKRSELHC